MGVFLFILGIILVLNVFPLLYGLASHADREGFLTGFLTAWVIELIIVAAIGFFCLIGWLISTGWTMMHEPEVIY